MTRRDADPPGRQGWGWGVAGVLLVAIGAALMALSPQFAYGALPVLERPTATAVALMVLAGGVYLAALWGLRIPAHPGRGWWIWVLIVGLGLRALAFPSTPILETDYFRYLWDGAVVAHGHDPYAFPPAAVLAGEAPAALLALAGESGEVLGRVNHPHLTTIYPPTAQAAFAAAHALAPWSIAGLRGVFLLLDAATLALLLGLLGQLGLPRSLAVIYWWNPLLIKEGLNTAHMEPVLLPLLVAAVWLAVRLRLGASVMTLALAAGAKLWPLVLLPALLRQRGVAPAAAGLAAALGIAVAAALLAPMVLGELGPTAGLRAYAATWQVNASLFQGLLALAGALGALAPPVLGLDDPHRLARLLTAALVLGWAAWLCRRPAPDGRAVCARVLGIAAALFLLSPTQYPWYWLWLLPLLAVRPSPGLLVLTATLPLYYLRFPLRELGLDGWFDHGVVWLQVVPALVLLALEARRAHRGEAPATPLAGPVQAAAGVGR